MGFSSEMGTGHISWPSSSWVLSPISSTSWHQKQTVTISVTFTPSTNMSSGIVELAFPSDFSKPLLQIPLSEPLISGQDFTVTYSNFVLPNQGVYGPIGIYTRVSSTGMIIDSNQFFCSLSIASAKPIPTINSLSATFYDITKVYVNDTSSIYFDFSIQQNLWKYDTFYLYIDSHFTISNPICKSLKVIGQYNNINSTNPSALNTLSCYYDSSNNRVVIYGLGVDIYVNMLTNTGSITARLLVTGFANPNADYSDTTYLWKIYISRFALNTFIAAYQGSGPSTQPGTITVSSWLPNNGYDASEIVQGFTTYMNLSVVFPHDIPSTGEISIVYSGGINNNFYSWSYFTDGSQSDVYGNSNYILITPPIGGSCNVTATTVICFDFTEDIQASEITFTTYTNFISTSPSVVQITSYVDSGVTIIDQVTANPATVTYASSSSVVLATDFNLYFSTSKATTSSYTANTGPKNAYIIAYAQLSAATTSNDYTIQFPVSAISSETSIKINSTLFGQYSTISSVNVTTDFTGSTASLTGVSLTEGKLSYKGTALSGKYLSAIFYVMNGASSPGKLYFPYVGSNLYTRYEALLSVNISNTIYVYAKAITFIPSSPVLSFTVMCSDSGISGIPGEVSFTPSFGYSVLDGSTMYIDINILQDASNSVPLANDFNSGLITGELYPSYSNIPGVLYGNFLTDPSLYWTNFSSIASGSNIFIKFPMGLLSNLNIYSASISVYYTNTSRTDIKNVIFSSTSTSFTSNSNTANWNTQTITSTVTNPTNYSIPSLAMTLNPAASYSTTPSGFIGLLLPTGFQVSSYANISQASHLSGVFSFTSNNIYYKTPGIFGSLGASPSTTTSFTFGGLITTPYFNPSSSSVTIKPLHASAGGNAACISSTGTYPTLTLAAASILLPVFTSSTAIGGGPDSLAVNVPVQFENINDIPTGGSIRFSLYGSWVVTSITTLNLTVNSVDITSETIISLAGNTILSNLSDIPSGSTIMILLNNLLPPSNTGVNPNTVGIISSITTYATNTLTSKIDSWTDLYQNATVLTSSLSSGNITITDIEILPNSTSTLIYFKLSFTADHSLPKGGMFSISSPVNSWQNSGDVSSDCFCSLSYSSCTVSSNLQVTISENYVSGTEITIILYNAFQVSSSGEGLNPITITSLYGSYSIDSNSLNTTSIYFGGKPNSIITLLTINPLTAGELANYTIYIPYALDAGVSIQIVFPDAFDPLLGNAYEKYIITNPGILYIDCFSNVGHIDCSINQRVVSFSLPNTLINTTTTTFILSGIHNPAYSSSYLPLRLYIYNATNFLNFSNENIQIAGITQLPSSTIEFRSISVSSYYLQQTSNYVFQFILTSSTSIGDQFVLTFPEIFDLTRDSGDKFVCSLSFINTGLSLTTSVAVNGSSYCINLRNNQISYNMTQAMSWNSSLNVYLTVKGIENADWGYDMSPLLDSNVYTLYDYWTSQFSLKIISGTSYKASSWENLNTGYSGFYENSYTFEVNGYAPNSNTGIITLIPGTQTNTLYITTSPFQSLAALLTPNNFNNPANLTFSSSVGFIINNQETIIDFRVSAPITAVPSLNYITWTLVENPFTGSSTKYTAPIKSRVEIYKGTVPITVGSIGTIAVGTSSSPVSIALPNSPESSLTVTITASSLNISITPHTLTFTPGVNLLYFQVGVGLNYTGKLGSTILINFTLSGTDSPAFTISNTEFQIKNSSQGAIKIQAISFSNVGRTTLKATVITNYPTVVCWALSHKNSTFPTYEQLLNTTASLIGDNGQKTFNQQITAYLASISKTPYSSESWTSFNRRLFKSFIQKVWTGCTYTGTTYVDIFDINWLWAGTPYKVLAYAGTSNVTNSSATVTTSSYGDSINITMSIAQKVDQSYLTTIMDGLASGLGIYSEEFDNGISTLASTSSFIEYIFYTDRSSALSPSDVYNSVPYSSLLSSVSTVLKSIGIISTPYISFIDVSSSSYSIPKLYPLSIPSYSGYSITIQTNSTVTGEICCVAQNATNSSLLSAEEIMLGLLSNNTITSSACVSNNAGISNNYTITVGSLSLKTAYTISCVACNSYPVWPYCGTILNINATTNSNGNGTVVVSNGFQLALSIIGLALLMS